MNLFLEELLQGDGNSALEALAQDLAAPEVPHVCSAVVAGPLCHGPPAKLQLIQPELEGDFGIISFLDDRALDDQLNRRQSFGPVRVFPVPYAKQLGAVAPGKLNRTALAGLDLLGDAPLVEASGFGIQAVDNHESSL